MYKRLLSMLCITMYFQAWQCHGVLQDDVAPPPPTNLKATYLAGALDESINTLPGLWGTFWHQLKARHGVLNQKTAKDYGHSVVGMGRTWMVMNFINQKIWRTRLKNCITQIQQAGMGGDQTLSEIFVPFDRPQTRAQKVAGFWVDGMDIPAMDRAPYDAIWAPIKATIPVNTPPWLHLMVKKMAFTMADILHDIFVARAFTQNITHQMEILKIPSVPSIL